MNQKNNGFILIVAKNDFDNIAHVLICKLFNRKIKVLIPGVSKNGEEVLKKIPFMKKYMDKFVSEEIVSLRDYKGLWYVVNDDTKDFTQQYFDKIRKQDNILLNLCNLFFCTEKVVAFLKKNISLEITSILEKLHYLRKKNYVDSTILIKNSFLGRFVVRKYEEKYCVKFDVEYQSLYVEFLRLILYYAWFLGSTLKRGFSFGIKRKKYKLVKEIKAGFYNEVFSDDALIDEQKFNKSDILFLQFNMKDEQSSGYLKDAESLGYDCAILQRIKVNLNLKTVILLGQYLVVPPFIYLYLFFVGRVYLFEYVFKLFREAFVFELLMNIYEFDVFYSTADHGDVVPSIVFNKYGTKSVISHWSDMTTFKDYKLAFIAHNIYFAWGDIHYDFHSENLYIDKKVNVGCIYKKQYSDIIKNQNACLDKMPLLKKRKETVCFFDSSFGKLGQLSELNFLEYFRLMTDYCDKNSDVNVLYRPKESKEVVMSCCGSFRDEYLALRDKLMSFDNLFFVEQGNISTMEAIILSDLVISFGMSSPSTITLIIGKEALYFNNMGNKEHPFVVKYNDKLVFETKDALFLQMNNILQGKFKCGDVLTQGDIRSYDAFDDDLALDRIKEYLSQMCS